MQEELFIEQPDYYRKKVLIGLSGGINSMSVLCWLANCPEEFKPKELHLFYAHFEEHSPDTLDFVLAGLDYAKKKFQTVVYMQTNNSVLEYFRTQKIIPHPIQAPCTRQLKIEPISKYIKENQIDVDLVGYVREEKRRAFNMAKKSNTTIIDKTVLDKRGILKAFPIIDKDNEWCFQIVKKEIGWYPKIYDIKDAKGERVFPHNNCLPCKNMQLSDFEEVKKHFPDMWEKAVALSEELKQYWGRDADAFYLTFGREDWETGFKKQSCEVCSFD